MPMYQCPGQMAMRGDVVLGEQEGTLQQEI